MSNTLLPPKVLRVFQYRRFSLHYTTTAATPRSTFSVPPESPAYIKIPLAPQPQARRKPEVKGVLPVPRDIFPPNSKDKTSSEYLAATAPTPRSTKTFTPVSSPDVSDLAEWTAAIKTRTTAPSRSVESQNYVDWKARQAVLRRRNLREGLVELYKRKQSINRQSAARAAFRQSEHERKIQAAERDDESYTNSSIVSNLKVGKLGALGDPQREERVAQRKARFEAHKQVKKEERQYTLHSLYMNARTFIVDEAALDAHLNDVFNDAFYTQHPDRSIWDREKLPDTVRSLLQAKNRSGHRAIISNAGYAQTTNQRVKRIAEELTGGKM